MPIKFVMCFIDLDLDRSGRISKQELAKAIESHKVECKDLDRVFANIDIDNSAVSTLPNSWLHLRIQP